MPRPKVTRHQGEISVQKEVATQPLSIYSIANVFKDKHEAIKIKRNIGINWIQYSIEWLLYS